MTLAIALVAVYWAGQRGPEVSRYGHGRIEWAVCVGFGHKPFSCVLGAEGGASDD
jgi:hypothetical protein